MEKKTTTDAPAAPASTGPTSRGLEGIVAASSAITYLDGIKGRMIYRGYDIVKMSGDVTFEEVLHLLWEGELPSAKTLETFNAPFVKARAVAPEVLDALTRLPKTTHPMDVLRTGVSLLGIYDPDGNDNSPEAIRRKAIRIVAQMPTLAAAWHRLRQGLEPIHPKSNLGHSANFLYMMTGKDPEALESKAMDLYLNLLADHSLNASTFTARVVVSTLSDIYSAITGAIGSLKGPLHGGANEKAMEMFIDIGDPQKADAYIEQAITDKKKIMGFGHRVYKVDDPRSVPLKEMSRRLSEVKGNMKWYDISNRVAESVLKRKKIYTNVDFYSASVLYLVGIPVDFFTPIFAISRAAGWTAHLFEQFADNRLIRPDAEYVGPSERPFVPVDQRR
jgi:citrate synthase